MAASIRSLEAELIELVKSIAVFKKRAFSIFNEEDLMRQQEFQDFPLVGVSYNGSSPVQSGSDSANVSSQSHAAMTAEHQFLIVIAVQYQFAGQTDNKSSAQDILDQVRSVVLGYKGVNSRPWRWMGERPAPEASSEGVVFYSQVWHTVVPVVGNFNNA